MQPANPDPLVVLVDNNDRQTGTCPKLAAHQQGRLHRAVSVFVFDGQDRLLLQRRALTKYHSGGLWSNTCCTHPGPGEIPAETAVQRLREEMGFTCELKPAGNFVYRAEFDNGLIEYEYDHLFVGQYEDDPRPDPAEVCDWSWMSLAKIQQGRQFRASDFTVWFWPALDHLLSAREWK